MDLSRDIRLVRFFIELTALVVIGVSHRIGGLKAYYLRPETQRGKVLSFSSLSAVLGPSDTNRLPQVSRVSICVDSGKISRWLYVGRICR